MTNGKKGSGGAPRSPSDSDSGGDGQTGGTVKGVGPGSANPPGDDVRETSNRGFGNDDEVGDDSHLAIAQGASTLRGENDPLNPSASPLEMGRRVLAQAHERAESNTRRGLPRNAVDMPASRNYANEAFVDELVDGGEHVLDMMAPNIDMLLVREQMPDTFREFKTQMDYEAFMHEPVVIRIHESKDKNDPPLVFIGVNNDNRWAPRGRAIKLPRKLIERLAQAQEMTFQTIEGNDPRADSMMQTIRRTAASYSFSVLHDPNPVGRQWLRRVTREGT